MSIREGLARNRRVYARMLGRPGQEEALHLPDAGAHSMMDGPAPLPPETFSLAPALSPEASDIEQAGRFSLISPPEGGPEDAANYLLRAIEREGRFVSQNLHGEE